MQRAILELLANCCIQEHSALPFCVNPLSVVEGKKLRLVIDLRHINQCLVLPKLKYEDLRSLSEFLDEGGWFFTWDLKSGYHHPDHQRYLSFAWNLMVLSNILLLKCFLLGLAVLVFASRNCFGLL